MQDGISRPPAGQRICFLLRIRPGRAAEYRARHAQVWPEMLEALRNAGWHNYSLFLRADGTLVGYLECEDFEAAQAAMQGTDVNARWQREMAEFFELDPDTAPDDLPILTPAQFAARLRGSR